MRHLIGILLLGFAFFSPITSEASKNEVSTTIDGFVSQLYPKGSHYFWVINDVTNESSQEMIIDVLTIRQFTTDGQTEENRFLLLIIQGKLFAAQKIPLGAEVDCGNEEEV